MTQPNFLKMVTVLACWAKAAKGYLEYQAKHGKPPLSPDEVRAEILRSRGIKVPPSPNPFFDLLAKWKKTGKVSPINLVFDNSSNPFYQLFCVAQKVLEFPASQWPAGVAGSKAIDDLLALLRPIEEGGGRSANIADLKRIEEVVKSIMGGKALEAKEPPDLSAWQCPKKSIPVRPQLRGPLHDYLTGEKEHKVEKHTCPYKIKSALKKLIQLARDRYGYDPDPNGWPTATLADEEGMIYFNAKEDGNARNQGKRKKA